VIAGDGVFKCLKREIKKEGTGRKRRKKSAGKGGYKSDKKKGMLFN
jgi:hypothetical protein